MRSRVTSKLIVIPTGAFVAKEGGYATYATYGTHLNELGRMVGGIVVYAPLLPVDSAERQYFSAVRLDTSVCDVVPLPGHERSLRGLRVAWHYVRHLATYLADIRMWRQVLVYSPSASGSLAVLAMQLAGARSLRVYSYVWGDWAQLSPYLPQRGALRLIVDPLQRRWIPSQERWLVTRSEVALVAGPALRLKYADLGSRVVETVPMIDIQGLLAESQDRDGAHPMRLLYVGRVVPGKGVEILLRAFARLGQRFPTLSLRIVGGGTEQYLDELRGLADELGVAASVGFVGVIPNGPGLWAEYRASGVFVMPSLSEGFPRVLYEAMALGVPIVATSVGSVPLILRNGVEAVIVPAGDELALTDGIKRVLDDSGAAARRAQCGRRALEERLAARRNESKAEQIAQYVLGDERHPSDA